MRIGICSITLGVLYILKHYSSLESSSVAQSCLTLCDPMDCSTPGFPVHHQLLEFAQTHVHPVGGAIQPSHPLSSPSPPAFNLSQHQSQFFISCGQSRIILLNLRIILLTINPDIEEIWRFFFLNHPKSLSGN